MAGLVSLALACADGREAFSPERVVLVTIDTLRADHLSSYGYAREVSPFIDGLAREGVRFENVITHMPTTAPSHASLFTSRYPFEHGLITNYDALDPAHPTLAEAFRARGFATAGFSAINFLKSLERGFDHFEYMKPGEKKPGSDEKKPNRKADETVDLVIAWLDQRPSDRFFLWIHVFDVHQWLFPRDTEPAYLEKVQFASKQEEQAWRAYLAREHGIPKVEEIDYRAQALLRYDAQLLFADRQLERLYQALELRGLGAGSLWVITSDHGEGLWNHDEVYHTPHLYDEQLRVPLIFHAPGGRLPTRQVNALVRLVDVFPTLAEWVGLEFPAGQAPFSGRSLLPLVYGDGDAGAERYAFSQRHPKDGLNKTLSEGDVFSIRDPDFKYIYHSRGPSEFYDLRRDPLELENRAAEPSPDRERLAEALELRFRRRMGQVDFPARSELDEDTLRELEALGYVREREPDRPPDR